MWFESSDSSKFIGKITYTSALNPSQDSTVRGKVTCFFFFAQENNNAAVLWIEPKSLKRG